MPSPNPSTPPSASPSPTPPVPSKVPPSPSPGPSPTPSPSPSPGPSPSPSPRPSPSPSPSPQPGALRECITAIDVTLTGTGAEDTQYDYTANIVNGNLKGYGVDYVQPFKVTISYTVTRDPSLTSDAFATLSWVETCNVFLYQGQQPNVPYDVTADKSQAAQDFFKNWTGRTHDVGPHTVTLDDKPGLKGTADNQKNRDPVNQNYTNKIQITGTNPQNCTLPKITKTVNVDMTVTDSDFAIPPTQSPTVE